jgi:hypothetical protein
MVKIPNNSEKSPIIPEKFTQRNRFAKGFWTPVSEIFFDFRSQGIITPDELSVSLMLLHYCNKNNLKFNFEMSRRELAMISNCTEKTAIKTLSILVRSGLLKEVFKRKGCHSKFAWNVDNFETHVSNLSTRETGTCVLRRQDLSTTGTGPVYVRDNTCIVFIINILLIRISSAKSVFVENFNDAVDTASVVEFAEASWTDAIRKCCRAFGYDIVHLIIKNQEINFFEDIEPAKTLAKLCRSPGLISELRDRYQYFKSDKDFAFYVEKNMKSLTHDLIKQEKPEWYPAQ